MKVKDWSTGDCSHVWAKFICMVLSVCFNIVQSWGISYSFSLAAVKHREWGYKLEEQVKWSTCPCWSKTCATQSVAKHF